MWFLESHGGQPFWPLVENSIISQWVRPKTARRGHLFVLNLKLSEDAYLHTNTWRFLPTCMCCKASIHRDFISRPLTANLETRRLAGFMHTYIHTYIILWRRIRGDSRYAQSCPERSRQRPLCASLGLSGPLWAYLQPTNQPASHAYDRLVLSTTYWPLWASLCLSEPLWASFGLSGPLWDSLSLPGSLWAALGLSGPLWAPLRVSGPLWSSGWSNGQMVGPMVRWSVQWSNGLPGR